jgi:signal transduction histidine kinase
VTDSGPGVAAGLGERIFEPFFTTRETTGGTGLGLWLSRSIIEEEGGTLTYCNVVGRGARFSIRLPAYRYETHHESRAQP